MSAIEIVPLGQRTLEELACEIRDEHSALELSLASAVLHAIRAGEALLIAREHFTDSVGWHAWVTENLPFTPECGNRYMRLAFYKEHIPLEVREATRNSPTHTTAGVEAALKHVRGLPQIRSSAKPRSFDYAEARRLRKSGLSLQQTAELLGASKTTVRRASMTDTERRRYDQAERARKRERLRDVRRHARPDLAEAYSLIRRALQHVQGAHDDLGRHERHPVVLALNKLHEAEDAVSRAMKVTSV